MMSAVTWKVFNWKAPKFTLYFRRETPKATRNLVMRHMWRLVLWPLCSTLVRRRHNLQVWKLHAELLNMTNSVRWLSCFKARARNALTMALHIRIWIKGFKEQDIITALVTHIVPSLALTRHQIHCRARVMLPHVVRLHQIRTLYRTSITNCNRPVFYGRY